MMPVFVESSAALPLVRATVAFEGGTAADPPGKEGLAYVTSRMLMEGAAGLSAEQIVVRAEGLGGELACNDVRVTSSLLRLSVLKRSVEPMTDLVSRVLGAPTFDEQRLAALLREVESDLKQADDNEEWVIGRAFRRVFFAGHPYGRSMSVASVRSITRADVLACYARQYGRGDAVAVSGDVAQGDAEDMAARFFGGLVGSAGARVVLPEPPSKTGRHLVFLDKPERTQCTIMVGTLGTHVADPDYAALTVANAAFGGSFNSRLMEEVRVKRGWSYGANSQLDFGRTRDAWTIHVQPKGADAAGCLALVLELLHRLREEGLTQAEVDRVKQYIVRSNAFTEATASQRVRQKLNTHIYQFPADFYARFTERVGAVTLAEANAAVRRRLSEDDLVVAVLGTHAEHGAAIEKAIPNLAGSEVTAFDAA